MTMSTVPCVLQCGGLFDEAADAISTESWDSLEKNALLSPNYTFPNRKPNELRIVSRGESG